eukprot:TRINITY_DN25562_c0_g1_i1.p1 TRINITY_DN25562_c0_g1~~TRINITY_DN25562_c0_g1_i1.p1  ORF type:complete len:536 (-),score=158.31 TRINITY_DN25562_c0_g1_i1:68-1675(-)
MPREKFEDSAKNFASNLNHNNNNSTSVVSKDNPGNGVLVDCRGVARPVGDTSSGAIYVSDLPKNFHGGDQALHFALCELFGQYGKIKKVELYMDKGILDTETFKGDALVAFQPSKKIGTREKGDPVWEICTDMDGKFRNLGPRMWRMRVEPAVWQKEGFDVKTRAKKSPCVELSNLWEYNPAMPLSYFLDLQGKIRDHCATVVQNPFVKVDPMGGTATVWCKAQDAMKLASIMQKSYFLERKVRATLARKEKPAQENLPSVPKGDLSLDQAAEQEAFEQEAKAAAEPEPKPMDEDAQGDETFILRAGTKVILKDLKSSPADNGRKADIVAWLPEVKKYRLKLEGGRAVKVKAANVEVYVPPEKDEEMEGSSEEDAADAANVAKRMAMGTVKATPLALTDENGGFVASVCVDPALLPKKEEEKPEPIKRRESSRSRERRIQERIDAAQARVAENKEKGGRPSWVVPSAAEQMAAMAAAGAPGAAGALKKEPEESREELLKMSVGKLKELLKEYGKTARGCIEKKDFVDRLKPPPKQ